VSISKPVDLMAAYSVENYVASGLLASSQARNKYRFLLHDGESNQCILLVMLNWDTLLKTREFPAADAPNARPDAMCPVLKVMYRCCSLGEALTVCTAQRWQPEEVVHEAELLASLRTILAERAALLPPDWQPLPFPDFSVAYLRRLTRKL
jgi:hypothetical protein